MKKSIARWVALRYKGSLNFNPDRSPGVSYPGHDIVNSTAAKKQGITVNAGNTTIYGEWDTYVRTRH